MKILVAVDDNPYSSYVVREVGKLVGNTWADITLLGILPDNAGDDEKDKLISHILDYRKKILSCYDEKDCPYSMDKIDTLKESSGNLLYANPKGGMKDFQIVIRKGPASREILRQSEIEESDLILIGCAREGKCIWKQGEVPVKVATDANCSVLVVKETKNPRQIVCCLDHDHVTQYSLEMINQMVTLYKAELKIVGISESDVLKEKVEKKMKQLLEYYNQLKITPWLEVVDASILPSFVAQEAKKNLVALWMGPKSFLARFFPKKYANSFINDSPSTVLFLR